MPNLPNNPRSLPILRKPPELFAVQFFKINLNWRAYFCAATPRNVLVETEREKSLVYISCNWVPKFQLGCVSWSDTFILAAICELWLDCLTWTELKWTDVILCANLPRRCFGLLRRWQFATSLHLVEWAAWTTSSVIHLQILRNGTSMWIGLHRAADSAVAVWM